MSGFTKLRQEHRRSTPTRRDVSRPGRLYWLAGRRSATENWDAFEAPRGEPSPVLAPPTSDWRQVHRALSSLATELDASAREDMDTRSLILAQVWRRADGHLVLLDFPWPGLVATGRRRSISILSRCWRPSPRAHLLPTAEPAAPLSGTTLLNRLASGAPPALADVKAELLRLASIPSRPVTRPSCPADGDGGDAGGRTCPDRQRDASHVREIPPGRCRQHVPAEKRFHEVDDVAH